MVAHRRADVADLNARARERLSRGGMLGADEIEVAGRSFATGERVVACRNDRRSGVANGTRGKVIAVDVERSALVLELDGGARVELDRSYLSDRHLDYGYALTAHRAQGATVDQALVLGSDELYREWGYTALTRHRESAFFYVNGVDTQLELDGLERDEDPSAELMRALERSGAETAADFPHPICGPATTGADPSGPGSGTPSVPQLTPTTPGRKRKRWALAGP
jgi:ATP-dependent exoDNAse (exonuclease V) alpha subunit